MKRYYAIWGCNGYIVVNSLRVENRAALSAILAMVGKNCASKLCENEQKAREYAYQMHLQVLEAEYGEGICDDYDANEYQESALEGNEFIDGYYHVVVSKKGFGVYRDLNKLYADRFRFGKEAFEKSYNSDSSAKRHAKKAYNELMKDKKATRFGLHYSDIQVDKCYRIKK